MSQIAQPGQQAENVASTITTAQGAIPDSIAGSAPAESSTTPNDLPTDFESISALLYGGTAPAGSPGVADTAAATAEPAATETPAGEQTPPVEPETAQPEQPPAQGTETQPEATGPGAGERIIPSRISTGQFAPTTQRAMALMHELNGGKPEGSPGAYSLSQCLNMVAAADGGQSITLEPAAEPEASQAEPSQVQTLESEIAEIEAQLTEAGENQVLFGADLAKAISELTDKKAQLHALRAVQEQVQTTQVQSHVSQREAVKARVVQQYPDANDKGTILGSRVATLIEEWKNPANPNHTKLNSVEAPELVVLAAIEDVTAQITRFGVSKETALKSLGVTTPQQAPAAQPAAPSQPTAPLPVAGNKVVTVASGSSGTGSAPRQISEADILAAALTDPDQFSNLLGYGNSGFHLRG